MTHHTISITPEGVNSNTMVVMVLLFMIVSVVRPEGLTANVISEFREETITLPWRVLCMLYCSQSTGEAQLDLPLVVAVTPECIRSALVAVTRRDETLLRRLGS